MKIQFAAPALILAGGLVLTSGLSFAKPEYTKKEKKGCVTCHVTATSKELNVTGKCYSEKKSLEGCPTPAKK